MAQAVATLFDLDGAVFARCAPQASEPGVEPTAERLEALALEDRTPVGEESGLTCSTCGAGAPLAFASLEAQRAHFSADWHRFNLKRRLAGLAPVTEERFDDMLGEGSGEELGSISGSASDDSSDDGGERARGGPAGPSETPAPSGRYFTFRDPGKGLPGLEWVGEGGLRARELLCRAGHAEDDRPTLVRAGWAAHLGAQAPARRHQAERRWCLVLPPAPP